MSAPAGWYPDPLGRHDHRYWDGERWTDHASRAGEALTDPVDGSGPPVQGETSVRWDQATGTGTGLPALHGTEGLAIVSLILSVVWLGGLGSIAGIVTGVLARRRIKRSGGTRTGSGIALAGIIIGVLTLGLTLLIGLAIAIFAIGDVSVTQAGFALS